ncbi:MAG: hypothetical protein M3Q68_06720 [Actinomycetota bacterium]|nr:hypothetical protein [Actinomycetota bacterium]
MSLLVVEIERSLRRRMVWALVAIAVGGLLALAIIAFISSAGLDPGVLEARGERHPAVLAHWWDGKGGDSPLTIAAIFLLLGGLIGGAGVVGGEWRAGNVATLLTWEPRRGRVLAARLGAIAVCSFLIAAILQVVLLAALLPAVVAHGTTAGADRALALSVGAAILRISALTAVAALLAGCLASVSRSTAIAIVGIGSWLTIGEGIVRARRPSWTGYLVGENLTRTLTWNHLEGTGNASGPEQAALVLGSYLALAVLAAWWVFRRADATVA